jgi:hypothetical protein
MGDPSLTEETRQGFEILGKRSDNVMSGEHREEHDRPRRRVSRIEEHLGLPSL